MIGNILKPDLQGIKKCPIYGAEWAGTSDTSWTRTDSARNFSAPNPYYSGMSTTPNSPFDNIMPWSGMRRVTDSIAGELVEMPKFYYKWTLDGIKIKLQISMGEFDGSYVAPVFMTGKDDIGEKDYVYIGRYRSSSSSAKSLSGYYPAIDASNWTSQFNYIHNLGSTIWLQDIAMYQTIRMLYLVEFANWDAQATIGYGCSPSGSIINTGGSDSMPYHTGTMASSRSAYGITQYRNIEDLQGNCSADIIHGFLGNTMYNNIKATNNLRLGLSDSQYTTLNVGFLSGDGTVTSFTRSNVAGFEYLLIPSTKTSTSRQYTTMYMNGQSYGSYYYFWEYGCAQASQQNNYGLFCLSTGANGQYSGVYRSGRLMVLPSNRLAA